MGSFVALFPIVDPVGNIPTFLVLTSENSIKERHHCAKKIAQYTTLFLVVFLLIGGGILRFFGISLEVVRIAGGIVVFHTAWQMMSARPKLTVQENKAAVKKSEEHEDISFMPMTIPLLAGPAAIAATLGLSAQAGHTFSVATLTNFLAVLLAIFILGIVIYLCFRASSWLLLWLGETGIRASSRILGFFIMAVGVQLILNGISDWLRHLSIFTSFNL
ncbi:MarC family protein [Nostoc sp.]|uniref:MarC family protein n=1 Tax=Nostoc sp. TaxID=1180 RepID=UPI002FFCAF11